nr:hypothetical protein [Lachnospiraceae bacterium]
LTDRKLREVLRTAKSLNQEPGVHKLVLETLELMIRAYVSEKSKALPKLRLPGPFRRKSGTEVPEEPEASAEDEWYK